MTDSLPFLFCVGANHNSAGIEFREKLYLSKEAIKECTPKILSKYNISEAFILSTCNRLEFYGVSIGQELSEEKLLEIFVDLQWFCHEIRVTKEKIKENSYQFITQKAVEHLFRVASGLDSMVVGETQITGQLKDSINIARECNFLGSILTRLEMESLKTAKKVRTFTDIGKKTVSISHAAVDLSDRVCGGLKNHKVAVVGAGEMARIACQYLIKYNPKSIHVLNRTTSKAENLVEELGFGTAKPLGYLNNILDDSDIIISSTSSSEYVIGKEQVQKVLKTRDHKPLYLVDIALPRDIDPECSELEDVYIFDIDDLKQIVDENKRERVLASEKAKGIVIDSTVNFKNWIGSLNINSLILEFRKYLNTLTDNEIKKTLAKNSFHDISSEQKLGIEKLMESITKKIVRDVVLNLKNPPNGCLQDELALSLKNIFPLENIKNNQEENS